MFRTILCSLSGIAALAATAALAAPPSEQVTLLVRVSDLDLSRPAGAAVALQRIRAAAESACGGSVDPRQFERAALLRACVRSATSRTVAASHSPVLIALDEGTAAPLHVAAAR